MDLIALARTIQADKDRAIEAQTRRRRLIDAPATRPVDGAAQPRIAPDGRPMRRSQRPSTSGLPSR